MAVGSELLPLELAGGIVCARAIVGGTPPVG